MRKAWADYFDDLGVQYLFWSARRATLDVEFEKAVEKAELAGLQLEPRLVAERRLELARRAQEERESGGDPRVRLVSRDELTEVLEQKAIRALEAGGPEDPRNHEEGRRRVIGLVRGGRSATSLLPWPGA